jgi:hypothetical protein
VTGPTGPTGPAAVVNLGEVFNQGAQTVPLEADVSFDSNGILSGGITHAQGTSTIVVGIAGVYRVDFSVSAVQANQFGIFVNGAAATGLTYGSASGSQQNGGHGLVALQAGDIVTLRNHSSPTAVDLQTLAGGTQTNVDASVTIERVSDLPVP